MNSAELTLIVAAGGRSTRMGTDKRFLPLDGETLLAHMLRKGSAAGVHSIVLAAEGERSDLAALAEEYGAYLVTDELPAQGPAAAIAAGLAAAKTEWALVLSGDMPFYDFELVRALLPEATGDTQVVLPTISGYWQPLAALYRRDAGTAFAAAIAAAGPCAGVSSVTSTAPNSSARAVRSLRTSSAASTMAAKPASRPLRSVRARRFSPARGRNRLSRPMRVLLPPAATTSVKSETFIARTRPYRRAESQRRAAAAAG